MTNINLSQCYSTAKKEYGVKIRERALTKADAPN